MSEMVNKAMDKIRDEMAGTKNDAVLEIGEAMTEMLLIAPEMSEQILAEGKTCAGAYKAVESYARSNRKNCVPPRKATELVAEYWGLPLEQMRRAVMGAGMQALAEGQPLSPCGAAPLTQGSLVEGAGAAPLTQGSLVEGAGAAPLTQGSLAGESAGSLLDDFDALLGGL